MPMRGMVPTIDVIKLKEVNSRTSTELSVTIYFL